MLCKDSLLDTLVLSHRHVEVSEEVDEVEEFQLIEKLQQLGINQGESALQPCLMSARCIA